jgi:hypothetical protein
MRPLVKPERNAVRERRDDLVGVPRAGRTLVAGWFSFEGRGATAGDLLARDVACEWLEEAGSRYDVAHAPPFPGGVDWRKVDPQAYSRLLFVCGPFYVRRKLARHLSPSLAGALVELEPVLRRLRVDLFRRLGLELLVRRFAQAELIGLDVSVLGPPGAWQPFSLLWERDSSRASRPDLVFLADTRPVPVVGLILVEKQREYAAGMHGSADGALRRLVASSPMSVVSIDTRLDVPNPGGLRTPEEVESLIARMDLVLTTRLHGTVLALKNGVPAVVVDPIAGGAKVLQQAQTLGWPIVFTADGATDEALRGGYEFCRSERGRATARECRDRARELLAPLHDEFVSALAAPE